MRASGRVEALPPKVALLKKGWVAQMRLGRSLACGLSIPKTIKAINIQSGIDDGVLNTGMAHVGLNSPRVDAFVG